MTRATAAGWILTGALVIATVALSALERRRPRAITLVFSLDVDAAVQSGRLPANTNRRRLMTESLEVIEQRLQGFGLDDFTIQPIDTSGFEIALPTDSADLVEPVVDIVTELGHLQFRIEVLPDDQYSAPTGRKRVRVWSGTAEAFREFKETEVTRWQHARDAGVFYIPGERYYVAKIERRPGVEVADFLVLEAPDVEQDFGGEILRSPRVGRHPITGRPVVLFDIKIEHRQRFGKWTEENIQLPMAIVLNDEVMGNGRAPLIQEKLTDSVQISLGALNYEEGEKRAKNLATVLQTGRLAIRPRYQPSASEAPSLIDGTNHSRENSR